MVRLLYSVIFFSLILASQSIYSQIKNEQITGQSFKGEIAINASPGLVWEILMDVGQLTEICGYKYVSGAKIFSKVGDVALVKVWGDVANFMLVRSDNKKELRFIVDPGNGSYICGCQWKLSKSEDGTKVWYEEQYTESGPQTEEALEAQVKELNQSLMKLKQKAEK
jgi:hypothetical protein